MFLLSSIKYSVIMICSFYTFYRLTNHMRVSKKLIFAIPIYIVFSVFVYPIKEYNSYFALLFVFLSFIISTKLIIKKPINESITLTFVSFAISYFLLAFSSLMVGIVMNLLGIILKIDLFKTYELLSYIIVLLLELLIIFYLFKVKRVNKSLPIINNAARSDIATYISVTIVLSIACFSTTNNHNLMFLIPVFLTFICGLSLIFIFKNFITKTYIEKLKIREIENLNILLKQKDDFIADLTDEKDKLSSIIHRDNKILTSMKMALSEILITIPEKELSKETISLKLLITDELLNRQIINNNKTSTIKKTNVFSIDSIINYMNNQAILNNIKFDLMVTCNVCYLTNNILSENDLATMLADLIQNSIIAASLSDNRRILASLSLVNNLYEISVMDSGVNFNIDTLYKMGESKNTTHSNNGGSGIGLFTVFGLLKRYNASLIIEEYSNNIFTKCIKIRFDGKNEYIVKTHRVNSFILDKRLDMKILPITN